MNKFYSLLAVVISAFLFLQVNAGITEDSCRANFERVPSATINLLTAGFRAMPWNSSGTKPEQICWNFGDNRDTCIKYDPALSNDYFVTHNYKHAGTYDVCVKILYHDSCLSYKCKSVEIDNPDSCKANFEILSSTSTPSGKYFIAQPLHNNNKKVVEVCWNFGDSRDTCIQYSATHTSPYATFHLYLHPGIYNVCVKIKYDGGCESTYCKQVQEGEPDSCQADFEAGHISSAPLAHLFTALPWNNHNKKPAYICWKFGDGHDTCIQYSNTYLSPYAINHIYTAKGQYEVCIRIVYEGGCEAKKCKVIQATEPDSCRADFERIQLSSSNDPSHAYYRALLWNNNEKKPARICWSFGDGSDTCIFYPENYNGSYVTDHYYGHSGMYEVCAGITYYGGCEARKCKAVNVSLHNADTCGLHLFEITPSITSLIKEFHFSSLNNNEPARICWNFGDGTDTCINIEPNTTEIPRAIKHTYPGPGVYHACVKVLFHNGCIASDCHETAIRSVSDVCGGYYTDSLISAHTYIFKGFSVHKPGDFVTGYKWTFGDGSSGGGEQVTHTYNAAGVYRVCLQINTEKGCETRICNNVTIADATQSTLQLSPNPAANVLYALFYSVHNETVTITLTNSIGIVTRTYTRSAVAGFNTWDFDITSLLPGSYSLAVQSPNQFANGLFIKQ
ncbi:MAG: PKD domain-containing protein [Ginsengibacter sp.]